MEIRIGYSGLIKILPLLEQIGQRHYHASGGINIRIADHELRIDTENPISLISEASESHGLRLIYTGKDKYGESCFHVFDEEATFMEQEVPAPEAPEPVGRASDEAMQKQMVEAITSSVMASVNEQIEQKMEEFRQQFSQTLEAFGKSISDMQT